VKTCVEPASPVVPSLERVNLLDPHHKAPLTTTSDSLRLARAATRDDLIRRLFGIAIAVGFAATLAKMKWVQNGKLPDPGEFNQMLALTTALLATILGWDSHLLALRNAPLTDFARFLLHVVLVFVFMFQLMASTHPGCLLWTLAVIFFLYLLSDLLTIRAQEAEAGLMLRSIAKQYVSKHEAALILRDASLRDAPQDEGGTATRCTACGTRARGGARLTDL
jgi:hypothetical protein